MMKRGFFIAILLITVLFIAGCTSYPGDAVGKKLKSSSGDCAGGALPNDDGSCPDDAPTIDKEEMERRQKADLQAIGGAQNLPGTSGPEMYKQRKDAFIEALEGESIHIRANAKGAGISLYNPTANLFYAPGIAGGGSYTMNPNTYAFAPVSETPQTMKEKRNFFDQAWDVKSIMEGIIPVALAGFAGSPNFEITKTDSIDSYGAGRSIELWSASFIDPRDSTKIYTIERGFTTISSTDIIGAENRIDMRDYGITLNQPGQPAQTVYFTNIENFRWSTSGGGATYFPLEIIGYSPNVNVNNGELVSIIEGGLKAAQAASDAAKGE